MDTVCHGCGRPGGDLKRCGRCRAAWYCSRECQKNHHAEHKPWCRAGAPPAPATVPTLAPAKLCVAPPPPTFGPTRECPICINERAVEGAIICQSCLNMVSCAHPVCMSATRRSAKATPSACPQCRAVIPTTVEASHAALAATVAREVRPERRALALLTLTTATAVDGKLRDDDTFAALLEAAVGTEFEPWTIKSHATVVRCRCEATAGELRCAVRHECQIANALFDRGVLPVSRMTFVGPRTPELAALAATLDRQQAEMYALYSRAYRMGALDAGLEIASIVASNLKYGEAVGDDDIVLAAEALQRNFWSCGVEGGLHPVEARMAHVLYTDLIEAVVRTGPSAGLLRGLAELGVVLPDAAPAADLPVARYRSPLHTPPVEIFEGDGFEGHGPCGKCSCGAVVGVSVMAVCTRCGTAVMCLDCFSSRPDPWCAGCGEVDCGMGDLEEAALAVVRLHRRRPTPETAVMVIRTACAAHTPWPIEALKAVADAAAGTMYAPVARTYLGNLISGRTYAAYQTAMREHVALEPDASIYDFEEACDRVYERRLDDAPFVEWYLTLRREHERAVDDAIALFRAAGAFPLARLRLHERTVVQLCRNGAPAEVVAAFKEVRALLDDRHTAGGIGCRSADIAELLLEMMDSVVTVRLMDDPSVKAADLLAELAGAGGKCATASLRQRQLMVALFAAFRQ